MKLETLLLVGIGGFFLLKPQIKQVLITQYDEAIRRISFLHGNDPDLVKAIIKKESNFNPEAHNISERENSIGLGQINTIGETCANLGIVPERLFEPEYNIEAINRLLDDIEKRYTKIWDIIDAYNAGRAVPNDINDVSYVTVVWGYYTLYKAAV